MNRKKRVEIVLIVIFDICARHKFFLFFAHAINWVDLATGYAVDSAEALKIDLIERTRKNE